MELKRATPPNTDIKLGEPACGMPEGASGLDADDDRDKFDISLRNGHSELSVIEWEPCLTVQIGRSPGLAVFWLRILVFACVAFPAFLPVLVLVFLPESRRDSVGGFISLFLFCAIAALLTPAIPAFLIWRQTLSQLIKIENGHLVICRRSIWSVEARFPLALVGTMQIKMATKVESDEGQGLTWEFKGVEPTIRLGFWDMTTVSHGHGVIINCAGQLTCIALGLSIGDAKELVRVLKGSGGG